MVIILDVQLISDTDLLDARRPDDVEFNVEVVSKLAVEISSMQICDGKSMPSVTLASIEDMWIPVVSAVSCDVFERPPFLLVFFDSAVAEVFELLYRLRRPRLLFF